MLFGIMNPISDVDGLTGYPILLQARDRAESLPVVGARAIEKRCLVHIPGNPDPGRRRQLHPLVDATP